SLSPALANCTLIRFSSPHCPQRPELSTPSLHDALPICQGIARPAHRPRGPGGDPAAQQLILVGAGPNAYAAAMRRLARGLHEQQDRKSTRLNSSHQIISYAVFCLKKKKPSTNN